MPTKNPRAPWNKLRQSPRDWRCVRWLRKKPVPAAIVGETEDGEEITVKLVGKVGERPHWADATRALHECVKLTALDAEGNVLRVLEHDDDDPELIAEAQREEARAAGGVPTEYGSPLLAIDVPRLVKEIADSMERVATKTAETQAGAHSEAFKQMGNVLGIAMGLLTELRQQLSEERAERAASEAETETETSDEKDALIGAAMQKVFGGNMPTMPNGAGGGFDLMGLLKQIPPQQLQEFAALLTNGSGNNGEGSHG